VNHENRKLAQRLVDAALPARNVVFVEPFPGQRPEIVADEPRTKERGALEIVVTPPFSLVMLQLGLLGILFCFVRWPVFGSPRRLAPPRRRDFAEHVAAFGALLERAGDDAFARAKVMHYQQTVRPADRGVASDGPRR
jgi:hypothetical protein